ncbi:hypothetical protein Bca101_002150 [Brassica carinata]
MHRSSLSWYWCLEHGCSQRRPERDKATRNDYVEFTEELLQGDRRLLGCMMDAFRRLR